MIALSSLTRQGSLEGPIATIAALTIFGVAYLLVMCEDLTGLRKSTPVLFAAGAIWVLVSLTQPVGRDVAEQVKDNLHEFGELFLFLVVAMTYISAIGKREVFRAIGSRIVSAGFGLRSLFWTTGGLAFLLSPVADNLTTALVLGAVVVTLAGERKRFLATACTNIVVAANAGGAFSPFGDITTLMVWQSGRVPGLAFFALVLPALLSWLVPAVAMHLTLPRESTRPTSEPVRLQADWWIVVLLFLLTILTTIGFHVLFHLPPFLGMMAGLGYYLLYCYFECKRLGQEDPGHKAFDDIGAVQWDTLLFFFGVIMSVGGLAALGILERASSFLYSDLGVTYANVGVGMASAILDNVPVMFAVLTMSPDMDQSGWLLVTLTAGIGGSVLSVGSAAGALMGTSKGPTRSPAI